MWPRSIREDGLLRSEGPHAQAAVRRRLPSLSHPAPLARDRSVIVSPALRPARRLAVLASVHPRIGRVGARLRATCGTDCSRPCGSDRLADTRDVAILVIAAFASGGRRRSEAAWLRIEQPRQEPSVRLDPADEGSMLLPCFALRSSAVAPKTAVADKEGRAFGSPLLRRCGNGFSAPTSRRSRHSGRSPVGRGRGRAPDASGDQPHR